MTVKSHKIRKVVFMNKFLKILLIAAAVAAESFAIARTQQIHRDCQQYLFADIFRNIQFLPRGGKAWKSKPGRNSLPQLAGKPTALERRQRASLILDGLVGDFSFNK